MLQRGRKSALRFAPVHVVAKARRLKPPTYLDDVERQVFLDIVGSVSPQHFVASDLPLLVRLIEAITISRAAAARAATDTEALKDWERAARLQAALSTKLRLSPQTRLDPKTRAWQKQPVLDPPWENPK